MSEKMIGYVLLILGIFVIIFSAVNITLVFTKQIQPVQLFSGAGISLDPATLLGNSLPAGVATKTGAKQEIISGEFLNQTSNIFAHVFLMGFMASIGYKLSSLGVQLVRPIVIKVKGKNDGEFQVVQENKV